MTRYEKLWIANKHTLAEYMGDLQRKVDSGRHTGADVELLREAREIWMKRFEPSTWELTYEV